ncbi:MAG: hypothetical protein A2X64_03495 [Ignavibacteria bacterium GWF2_33_9]|nr:MAG: hypothetical protein A2X64_03495 [Ignavibacteria bacterium GWF2_33_9]
MKFAKKIEFQIEYFFLLILSGISIPLTRKMRTLYGKIIGCIMFFFSPRRRKIALENLKHAFPEKSTRELKKIRYGSFLSYGITFAELFALKYIPKNQIEKYQTFPEINEIMEIFKRDKGIIFLSGHYGNWEMMAYAVGYISELPLTIVVKPLRNKPVNDWLDRIRTYRGNMTVPMKKSAFELVKRLKRKETIALLVDQAAQENKDMFVDFFGRLATTYEAPAQLALKFDVPIIMGFNTRQPDGTYVCHTQELDHSDLSINEEGVKELTRRHVKILEDHIRKNPEQWSWSHRRWKHKPKINQNPD